MKKTTKILIFLIAMSIVVPVVLSVILLRPVKGPTLKQHIDMSYAEDNMVIKDLPAFKRVRVVDAATATGGVDPKHYIYYSQSDDLSEMQNSAFEVHHSDRSYMRLPREAEKYLTYEVTSDSVLIINIDPWKTGALTEDNDYVYLSGAVIDVYSPMLDRVNNRTDVSMTVTGFDTDSLFVKESYYLTLQHCNIGTILVDNEITDSGIYMNIDDTTIGHMMIRNVLDISLDGTEGYVKNLDLFARQSEFMSDQPYYRLNLNSLRVDDIDWHQASPDQRLSLNFSSADTKGGVTKIAFTHK